MFALEQISARYNGRYILKDVSFSINPGEKVALMGKSGSGKSTLIKIFYQSHKANCSLIPQDLSLVKQLSVFHNVYIGRLHQHSSFYNLVNLVRPQHKEVGQIEPILAKLDIAHKMTTPVGELSGGQQQRVAVARALFHNEQALLGDEPISALDSTQSQKVLEATQESFQTILLAMHDVQLALNYADRIIGIKDGQLAMDEQSEDLQVSDLDFLY